MSLHAQIATVVIDCPDPAPMIAMYTALGGVPDERCPGLDCLLIAGVSISFRRVQGYLEPTWPDRARPAHLHLDFFVDSPTDAETHLHRFGARTAPVQPHRDHGLIVMLDPAGNPFCVATRL